MKIAVIVPAFNEEKNLVHVLPRIPKLPEIGEVMIVDGHSKDNTIAEAKKLLPDARIVLQQGAGKGAAITSGALATDCDYFLILDADGSQMPEEIALYIEKAKEGFDLVKGSRFMPGGSSEESTLDRKIITTTAQSLTNFLWRTKLTDICYGMFLIRKEKYLDLHIQSRRHDVEWELMAKAVRRRLKIVEVPAYEAKRVSGSSHVSYVRDGWLIARTVFREFFQKLAGKE